VILSRAVEPETGAQAIFDDWIRSLKLLDNGAGARAWIWLPLPQT